MADAENSPLDRVEAYLAELDRHDQAELQRPKGRPFNDLLGEIEGRELKRSDLQDIVTKLRIAYGELAIGQGSSLMDEAWHQGADAMEEWVGLAKHGFGQPKPQSPYRPAE